MDGNLLLLAQTCHKFALFFHPHLWLWEFSLTECCWQFVLGEVDARGCACSLPSSAQPGLFWKCQGAFLALT